MNFRCLPLLRVLGRAASLSVTMQNSAHFLEAVAATKARFLARLTAKRKLPVLARLAVGTFLSGIGALTVRIIEAEVIFTYADGTR